MTQPKVVSLNVRETQKSTVPPILHSVRQHAKRQLNGLLQELFDNTDDALFEMADRSRSDSDQHMFFESMRQIRLHRKKVSTQFVSEFYRGIEDIFQAGAEAEDVDFDEAVDQLSLVQHDELEVSVAIAGIVSKVTSQFSLPIMQLTKRIDHLCKVRSVTERLNPLGPERVSRAFVSAIEPLEIDIKVRIILLKLFERFVMESLGPMYDESNSLLAEAGVLSDLAAIMRRDRNTRPVSLAAEHTADYDFDYAADRASGQASGREGSADSANRRGATGSRADSGRQAATAPQSAHDAAGSFGVIQSLLARARGGQPSPGAGSSEVISTPQLVTVLSNVQTHVDQQPFDLTQTPHALDLREVVVSNAEHVIGSSDASMVQDDDDTVNVVGMLFDYILNDRNLAIPMKALIGRLQIPIVKLAVIDKSFFEKTSHPARQLLNELSSAGIGWSAAAELKRDALYNKIESIVLRVMNSFKEDTNIFTELVEELRQFVNKDNKRHALVEQRVKETETGKARTVAAKETVQQLINQKASGMRLPPAVGRFVSDTWSKVLVYACVKEGTGSSAWQRDVQALDDLLWCLQPLDSMEDLERREELIPNLITALQRGMEHLKLADVEQSDLISMLSGQLRQMSDHDRAFLEDDEMPAVHESFEVLDEIVLTTPYESLEREDVTPPEPEFIEEINRLREGIWVEILQETGDRIRCKLAAIIKPGDRYVFVNRRGMKVVEKTRMGLAVELKKKALTILDESQVFDRALQAVIGNLRQMHRAPKT